MSVPVVVYAGSGRRMNGAEQTISPSGLGRRMIAWIIDTVVRWALLFLVVGIASLINPQTELASDRPDDALDRISIAMSDSAQGPSDYETVIRLVRDGINLSLGIPALIVFAFYRPILESWKGWTLGKYTMRIKVVARDGSKASPLQCFARYFVGLLDAIAIFAIPIGLIVAAWSRQHRRIGDMVAGTLVVADPG